LSDEGVIYRREFNEDAEEIVWQQLVTVSSTQFEVRPCMHSGCNSFFEVLPGATHIPDKCRAHRYRR